MKSLKTHMPDPKPAKIILYHNDCRKGKIFDLDQAEEKYEQMIDDGWVDSPADLEPIEPEAKEEEPIDPTMTVEEIVQKVKSLGFTVLTPDEAPIGRFTDDELLAEVDARGIVYVFDEKDPLINRFIQAPSELSKDELVTLGEDYDLKLVKTMNEETMIGHISQAIEDSKTEGD